MAVRRLIRGLILCLGMASAMPALAEDPAVRTQPLKTDLFEDVVDGIGGVLGVLVGPPISSPPPLNTSEWPALESPPPAAQPATVTAPPVVTPPQAAAPIVVPSPVAAQPVPPPPAPIPQVSAPPPVKAAVQPAPPPRPAVPAVAAPVAPPPPPAVAVTPACAVRVAATATLEQMRRLPKCP